MRPISSNFRWLAIASCFSTIAGLSTAHADVFELQNGGRLNGRPVASDDDKSQDKSKYVIELTGGGRVTIPRSQVTRIDSTTDVEAEYAKLAHSSPDTPEAHRKMAEWCRQRKLVDHMKRHFERILELDPNDEQARVASGFKKENGQWMTRGDVMAARGMVLYEGRYVTPQHVELIENQKQTKVAQADWGNTIDRLQRWLSGRNQDRIAQAQIELSKIDDPAAAAAVVDALRREKNYEMKLVWLKVASQINDSLTVDALVDRSLADPDEEIRLQSLDYLVRSRRPNLAAPYIRALRNRDNEIINRAGLALGRIGDPAAIGPLIDVLVTTHKIKLSDANPDQHAYSFSGDGSAFSFGGGGPKVVPQDFKNPAVLNALVTLSGGTSFDYDQEQWRRWLAAQTKKNEIDVRRDR